MLSDFSTKKLHSTASRWEAGSCSGGYEMPVCAWNMMDHFHVHKNLRLYPILNHLNLFHTIKSHFSKMHLMLS